MRPHRDHTADFRDSSLSEPNLVDLARCVFRTCQELCGAIYVGHLKVALKGGATRPGTPILVEASLGKVVDMSRMHLDQPNSAVATTQSLQVKQNKCQTAFNRRSCRSKMSCMRAKPPGQATESMPRSRVGGGTVTKSTSREVEAILSSGVPKNCTQCLGVMTRVPTESRRFSDYLDDVQS